MNSSIINKEIVEFEIVDKQQAIEVRHKIFELASDKIPVIIDDVVSKYFGKDDLLRIDQIEIDLGTLVFDNLEEEFTERFHQQFEEEIIKYSSGSIEYISPVEKVSSSHSDFELLTFFITTGTLPWWIVNKQEVKIDEILKRVVEENKYELLEFLKKIADETIFISRIVAQFSTSSINSLNILLKDSHDSFKHYYNFIIDIFGVELKQFITRTAFERILFESLISNLSQTSEVKGRTDVQVIEFIEHIAAAELLTPAKVKSLLKQITTSEIFKVHPGIAQVEKLIGKYFTGEKFNIRKDLPRLIEQMKELIVRNTFEAEVEEEIGLPESLEKETLLPEEIKKSGKHKSEEFEKEITGKKKVKDEIPFSIHEEKPVELDEQKFCKKKKLDHQKYVQEKRTKKTDDESHRKEKEIIPEPEIERIKEDELLQLEKGKVYVTGKERKVDREEEQNITLKGTGDEGKSERTIDKKIEVEESEERKGFTFKEKEYLQKLKSKQFEPAEIYIDNSGLVLIAAFIPAFFKSLGLVENDKFKNNKATERGMHLLQYLVNGREKSPEYVLALNKILCGQDVFQPVVKSIKITKHEKDESISLLDSVIKNWSVLKNTSIEGLRNSFLIRNGIITIEEDQFNLKVERKSHDMLLDHLPWSISIIKHSWMNKPVYVEW